MSYSITRLGRAFRIVVACGTSVSLAACVTAGSYWHRPGAASSEAQADLASCRYFLDNSPSSQSAYNTYTYQPMPGGVGGAIAAGIVGGIVVGIAQAAAAANSFKNCMRNRGYEQYAMTNDEQAGLAAIVLDSERERYLGTLMASGGENVRRGVTKADSDLKNASVDCPANQNPCIPKSESAAQLGVYDLWKDKNCPANRQPC